MRAATSHPRCTTISAWTALLALCAAHHAHAAAVDLADKKIAVLEFQSVGAARLQAPEAATDDCRGAVVSATREAGALVLTRENMIELLKITGGTCREGECEVETARNLGVDFFITGAFARIDAQVVLTLKAYETRKGALLAQRREDAATELALLDKVKPATLALVTEAFGLGSNRAAPGRKDVEVRFESAPAQATVRLDGELLCQQTPCTRAVRAGRLGVVFEKERYRAARVSAQSADGVVRATLAPLFGWLTVKTEPPGLALRLRVGAAGGKLEEQARDMGAAPLEAHEVDAGPVEVTTAHPCYLRVGERLRMEAGMRRTVRLATTPRLAGLIVLARNQAGDDVDGAVFVDGERVGAVGDRLKVPVCGRSLTVRSPEGAAESALALVEGRVSRVEVTVR